MGFGGRLVRMALRGQTVTQLRALLPPLVAATRVLLERWSFLGHWVVTIGPGTAASSRFFDKLVHFDLLLGGLLARVVVLEVNLAPFVGRSAIAHRSVNQIQAIQPLSRLLSSNSCRIVYSLPRHVHLIHLEEVLRGGYVRQRAILLLRASVEEQATVLLDQKFFGLSLKLDCSAPLNDVSDLLMLLNWATLEALA